MSKIIDTATELFARQGYHATGVAELGRAVGLGSGALYHYIGSKEDLLFTIVRSHLEHALEFGRDLLAHESTAVEKLHEMGREHMRLVAYRRLELLVMRWSRSGSRSSARLSATGSCARSTRCS
jgi:AcrR family transcriptional regulator